MFDLNASRELNLLKIEELSCFQEACNLLSLKKINLLGCKLVDSPIGSQKVKYKEISKDIFSYRPLIENMILLLLDWILLLLFELKVNTQTTRYEC